jgi:hypothetical protein
MRNCGYYEFYKGVDYEVGHYLTSGFQGSGSGGAGGGHVV